MRYLPHLTVAVQHYLQVTEYHFKQATKKSDAESDASRTHVRKHFI